jgi:hypothetical protein
MIDLLNLFLKCGQILNYSDFVFLLYPGGITSISHTSLQMMGELKIAQFFIFHFSNII